MEPRLQPVLSPPAALSADESGSADGHARLLVGAILEQAPDAVVVLDAKGRVVEWNPAAARLLGFSGIQARGCDLIDLLIAPAERDAYRPTFDWLLGSAEPGKPTQRRQLPAIRADGAGLGVEISLVRVGRREPVYAGFLREVERPGDGAAGAAEASQYRDLVERLPSVVYRAEHGRDGAWLFVSPQIEQLLGYTPAEWMQDPTLWYERIHPDDRDRVIAEEQRCAREGVPSGVDYRLRARSGDFVWVRDIAGPPTETGDQPACVEGLLTDITHLKAAEERLRFEAAHDDLTGLANRRHFEEELRKRLKGGSEGAVVIIDLDHLKFINDSMGHSAGDQVLREIAAALAKEVRESDVVARLAGDEFVVLLEGVDVETARGRTNEILKRIRSSSLGMQVTASAGIVTFSPRSPASVGDLLVAADVALYEAKGEGRDRAVIASGAGDERIAWVQRVRKAIDEDRLALYRQPIVDLQDGGVTVRHELLVRLFNGQDMLPPGLWLPAAERFGLIREIDEWVIRQAMKLMADGSAVSVNLSARSIQDPELTDLVGAQLSDCGADPAQLVFEITETAAAATLNDLDGFAERVRAIGCALAIDDFGTGFGSFTYLKHLPVSYLKIDMGFVRGLVGSVEDQRIVKSTVALARSLELRTVAEGVEDAECEALVRELGVDFGQGYHFGRPEPTPIPGELGYWVPLTPAA
jgi:diguanylate cyclase (GGDEF)-like protein/PAS domain S-box-containing protein